MYPSKEEEDLPWPCATWLVESSSTHEHPCHFSWQPSPCCLFAGTWHSGAWRQGRQGREGFGICASHCTPHPHKALSSSSVSGALGSDCLLPGARETLFCLLSHPGCPPFVLSLGGGGKWQRLFKKESFFFLPSLSSSYPLRLQEHFGFFPPLGVCAGDLNLLLFPINSLEVQVEVQSLQVSCLESISRHSWSWLCCW